MKKRDNNKKVWIRPAVISLDIKKVTSSGTRTGPEGGGFDGPPGSPPES